MLHIKQYVCINASKNLEEKDPNKLLVGASISAAIIDCVSGSRWIIFHSLHNGHITFSCSFFVSSHILSPFPHP